jgi:hypothetical protein
MFFFFFCEFPLVHSDLKKIVPIDTLDAGHEGNSILKLSIEFVDIDNSSRWDGENLVIKKDHVDDVLSFRFASINEFMYRVS